MTIKQINVLDHGFVKLLNLSGPVRRIEQEVDASDRDPAMVARISFDNLNAERTEDQDVKLSTYLIKNWHTSPFEMIEVWLEMKLPIFVARHFVRHRTTSLNEVSGRYVQLPAEWYIPDMVGGKPVNAKQGQSDTLSLENQERFKRALNYHCTQGYENYEYAIELGVAHEHARMLLSLNHYTHWVWKQNLHNMMHFLSRRDHPHAQIEAQVYAQAVATLLEQHLPHTMRLYREYRRLA